MALASAWNGSSWLIAGALPTGELSTVEVRPDGTAGEVHTIIRTGYNYASNFLGRCALVWDGSGYLISFIAGFKQSTIWDGDRFDGGVFATRLSDQGIPIQAVPLKLSSDVSANSAVCAVSRGGTTHVAWSRSGLQETLLIEVSAASPLRVNGVPGRLSGGFLQSLTTDGHGGYRLVRSVSTPLTTFYYGDIGELDVLLLTPGVFAYDERRTSIVTDRAQVACREDDCAVVFGAISQNNQNHERTELLFVRELTPTQPPAIPRVRVTRTAAGVDVSWDHIPNALGYLIEAAGVDEGFHLVDAAPGDGTDMLIDSTVVTVRVKAWNYGGMSPATTLAVPPPARRRATGH